jgi:hypothetical protein
MDDQRSARCDAQYVVHGGVEVVGSRLAFVGELHRLCRALGAEFLIRLFCDLPFQISHGGLGLIERGCERRRAILSLAHVAVGSIERLFIGIIAWELPRFGLPVKQRLLGGPEPSRQRGAISARRVEIGLQFLFGGFAKQVQRRSPC